AVVLGGWTGVSPRRAHELIPHGDPAIDRGAALGLPELAHVPVGAFPGQPRVVGKFPGKSRCLELWRALPARPVGIGNVKIDGSGHILLAASHHARIADERADRVTLLAI